VRVWDVGARDCVALVESSGPVWALAAMPDGGLAISGSWVYPRAESLIRVWALTAPGSPEDAAAAAEAERGAMVEPAP
jgi:hypothetical protein